ncbi:unnamed protein product [Polarella glacialis]|uniref:non-specific serine/threonine protein kinase n=2 Tax=Polarella glacialis TaxID=89957 RepID=A0A813G0I5_POLGL|nr:unnamed protein product [Polarella glacialis]
METQVTPSLPEAPAVAAAEEKPLKPAKPTKPAKARPEKPASSTTTTQKATAGAAAAGAEKNPSKRSATPDEAVAGIAAAAAAAAANPSPGPVILQPGQVIQGYEIMKPLGKGKFSIVYMAKHLSDGLMCAMKKINIFDMMVPKQREKCMKEVKLLQSLDHPNIVKLLDSFIDQHELLIIVEWAEKGDLKRLIRKALANETRFMESEIWEYSRQLAGALDHMHAKRIMHRDLKPANIFVSLDGSLKLGDLGLGRFFSSQTLEAFSKVGTPLYMSPEVLHGAGYDMRSDVWSLGCMIYELSMLRSPFKSDQQLSLYDLFVRISKGDYPPLTETLSADFRRLVSQMLALDPTQRLDSSKVLEVCSAQTAGLAAAAKKEASGLQTAEKRLMRPSPLLVMDDIIEKLKLLECEEQLLRPCGFPMLHRCFFIQAVTLPGQLSQFHIMHTLLRWLLGMLRHRAQQRTQWAAADASAGPSPTSGGAQPPPSGSGVGAGDAAAGGATRPQVHLSTDLDGLPASTLIQEMVADLQQQGIQVSCGSTLAQLKRGFGEDVCIILNELINQELLGRDFHFERPSWGAANDQKPLDTLEEEVEEELVDSHLETSRGGANSHSDEEGGAPGEKPRSSQASGLEPVHEAPPVDMEAWRQELERARQALGAVGPEYRPGESCDWRAGIAAAARLRGEVASALAGLGPLSFAPSGSGSRPSAPSRPPTLPARRAVSLPEISVKERSQTKSSDPSRREISSSPWLAEALHTCSARWADELERIRQHEERLGGLLKAKTTSQCISDSLVGGGSSLLEEVARLQEQSAVEADRLAVLREAVDARSAELSALEQELDRGKLETQERHDSLDDPSGKLPQLRQALRRLQAEDRQLAVRVSCVQGDLLARSNLRRPELAQSWAEVDDR